MKRYTGQGLGGPQAQGLLFPWVAVLLKPSVLCRLLNPTYQMSWSFHIKVKVTPLRGPCLFLLLPCLL
jgi:hypothetical protein